jgi:hypothetical protein
MEVTYNNGWVINTPLQNTAFVMDFIDRRTLATRIIPDYKMVKKFSELEISTKFSICNVIKCINGNLLVGKRGLDYIRTQKRMMYFTDDDFIEFDGNFDAIKSLIVNSYYEEDCGYICGDAVYYQYADDDFIVISEGLYHTLRKFD